MKISSWGAFVDCNMDVWMPILGMGHLVKIDKCGNVSYIAELSSQEGSRTGENILKVMAIDDKIYLFSRNTFELWIFDKKTLNINHYIYYNEIVQAISDIIFFDNTAWILPNSFDIPILKVDLLNLKTETISWCQKPYDGRPALVRVQFDGKCIYSATRKKNEVYILKIDVKKELVSFKKTDLKMINCIYAVNDEYWLFALDSKDDIVIRRYTKGFVAIEREYVINGIDRMDLSGVLNYFEMIVNDDVVYLIPTYTTSIYLYKLNTMEGAFLTLPNDLTCHGKPLDGLTFADLQINNGILYLFPHYFDQLIILDMRKGQFSIIDFKYKDELLNKLIHSNSNRILHENAGFDLNDFMTALSN